MHFLTNCVYLVNLVVKPVFLGTSAPFLGMQTVLDLVGLMCEMIDDVLQSIWTEDQLPLYIYNAG